MRQRQSKQSLWEVLSVLLITLASVTACDREQSAERQSPVDIAGYTTGSAPVLAFGYTVQAKSQAKSLTNTGEFVKVIYEDAGGIELDGQTY